MKARLIYLVAVAVISASLCSASAVTERSSESLSYENAVKFFRETLREQPLKVHKRCAVFFEGEYTNANIYSHSVIILENSDEDFEITFYISDDRGMFWVSEFLDSGFFDLKEKQALFKLTHGTSGNRTTHVGRYRVELTRAQPHHASIIVFSFTRLRR